MFCSIEVGWLLLNDEICISCYSGTRSHWRLIFWIMNSHRMYTLCTKYEKNRKWFIFECVISHGMSLQEVFRKSFFLNFLVYNIFYLFLQLTLWFFLQLSYIHMFCKFYIEIRGWIPLNLELSCFVVAPPPYFNPNSIFDRKRFLK